MTYDFSYMWLPEPTYEDMLKQSCIPLELRCPKCVGLGKVRGRYSFIPGDDYVICLECNGRRSKSFDTIKEPTSKRG